MELDVRIQLTDVLETTIQVTDAVCLALREVVLWIAAKIIDIQRGLRREVRDLSSSWTLRV